MASPQRAGTVVGEPLSTHLILWVVFPLAGIAVGAAALPLARWAAALPWVPYGGPVRTIATFSGFWPTVAAVGIGLMAGLAFGAIGSQDNLTVSVTDDEVTIRRGDTSRAFPRSAVSGVCRDRRELVVFGHAADELARERTDITADQLRPAFDRHHFPWLADGDPYRDDFRRWLPDSPSDLPAGAAALFKARDRALRKDEKHDIADLRTELARLGIVVRDEKKRQYWRRSRQPVDGAADPAT